MTVDEAPFPSHRRVAPLRDGDLSLEVETLQRAQVVLKGHAGITLAPNKPAEFLAGVHGQHDIDATELLEMAETGFVQRGVHLVEDAAAG